MLTKEIDRLPPDGRTLLRCAAVLGMRFSESMLREMLTATDSPAAGVDLASLDGLVEPEGEGRWQFQHALIREAAYAGLPYRLRRRMHRYAGRALEASSLDHEDVSERLSLHFSQAGDDARTWTYSRMAGRARPEPVRLLGGDGVLRSCRSRPGGQDGVADRGARRGARGAR